VKKIVLHEVYSCASCNKCQALKLRKMLTTELRCRDNYFA
jgi:hypothetical protein